MPNHPTSKAMQPSTNPPPPTSPLPPLEILGALSSRLLHDFSNHLAVISGNAQFAQMVVNDPQKLSKALQSLSKATEQVIHRVQQCSNYKQKLYENICKLNLIDLPKLINACNSIPEAWRFTSMVIPEDRIIFMDGKWVVHCIAATIRNTQSAEGTASIRSVHYREIPMRPGRKMRTTAPDELLEVKLECALGLDESMEDIKNAFDDLPFLAGFEMLQLAGGWIDQEVMTEPAPATRRYLYFPLASTE